MATKIFDWKEEKVFCEHKNLRGVYGDEIIFVANYKRTQCVDCLKYLENGLEDINVFYTEPEERTDPRPAHAEIKKALYREELFTFICLILICAAPAVLLIGALL